MAEFPVTKPKFITPSCVNLSTYIQGMSDYEVICYFSQLIQQWAIEWGQTQQDWKTQQEAFESFKDYVNEKLADLEEYIDFRFSNLDLVKYIDIVLSNHPEWVTTVVDGSLTEEKFTNDLKLAAINNFVTPIQYGAKGDGSTDDTDAIRAAIASGKPLLIAGGTFNITEDIQLPSNYQIVGGSGVMHFASTSRLLIKDVDNVVIDGVHITSNVQDFETDPNASLVRIQGSTNVTIKNCRIYDARTDAISVGRASGGNHCKNVMIIGNYINNAGRNGISVTDCSGCLITNNYIDTVTKFVPRCGIDIEPNFPDDLAENIQIDANTTTNCGWQALNFSVLRTGTEISVSCSSHLSVNDASLGNQCLVLYYNDHDAEEGITVDSNSGTVKVNNFTALSSEGWPIFVRGNKSTEDCKFIFDGFVESKQAVMQFYPGNGIQGNVDIRGFWVNNANILQFRSVSPATYENVVLGSYNTPVGKDPSNISGSITSYSKRTITTSGTATAVFDGASGSMTNHYGNIDITKSDTGKYIVSPVNRGIQASIDIEGSVEVYTNGAIYVKNKEGAFVDATVMVTTQKPSTIGDVMVYDTL